MCLRFLIIFLEPKWPLSSLEKTLFWEDKPPAKQGRALWETSPPGSNLSGELQSQSVRGQGLKRKHVIYIDIYKQYTNVVFSIYSEKRRGGGYKYNNHNIRKNVACAPQSFQIWNTPPPVAQLKPSNEGQQTLTVLWMILMWGRFLCMIWEKNKGV